MLRLQRSITVDDLENSNVEALAMWRYSLFVQPGAAAD
jgi:hypothetical protein